MLVFSTRYNTVIARRLIPAPDNLTEARLHHRMIFIAATALALADMRNPDTKLHWQQIATSSNGKYKTPRGAAFAHYYELMKNEE